MAHLLKRKVFLIGICCLGCGLSLGSLALAQPSRIYISNIFKEYTRLRTVSGLVTYNGGGLDNVGIYDGTRLLGVTNGLGFYSVEITLGLPTTLTPSKMGYQFSPPARVIPADQYDHSNQDFTAQRLSSIVTISGNVTWKNYSGDTTIPTNPLSMVAMEAYAQDGSLYSRVVTGADGKYSIDVPTGWTGRVQPYRLGFEFVPPQNPYFNLNQDQTNNYQAPHTLDYRVTVRIRDEHGNKLPSNEHIRVDFNGTDHAAGSHDFFYMDRTTGELFWDFRSGWIGEITPSNHQIEGPILYIFTPPSIRMSAPITSDMTFSFTAKPQ